MTKGAKSVAEVTWPDAVDLYHKMLYQFYNRGDRPRAVGYALPLLRALEKLDPQAESLPGNEYRAIIAEIDGDYPEAIQFRLRELRLFDRLIAGGNLESARLGWDDYADRFDLLACLYMYTGEWDEAASAIRRSEEICGDHGVPFDGADIKAEIEHELDKGHRAKPQRVVARATPRAGVKKKRRG
jgi:hypothetical protein